MREELGSGSRPTDTLAAALRRVRRLLKEREERLAAQQQTIDRQAATLGRIRRACSTQPSDLLFRREVRGALREMDGGAGR